MATPSRRNWGWSAISIIPAIKPGSKSKLQQDLDKFDLKVKVRAVLGPTTAITNKLNTLTRDRQTKIKVILGATAPLAARIDQLAQNRTVNFRPELASGPTGTATARLNDMARARTVTLRPELGSNVAAVETRLDQVARTRTARIDLDFAVTPQQVAAMRAITRLQDRDVRARVRIDVDQDQADRLARLGPSIRALNRLASKDVRIKIDLDVDEARLIRVAEAMRDIRSRTVSLNVRQNERVSGSSAGTSRLTSGLGSLGSAGAGAGAAAAKIALITGAAGLAAGAVGTLVAGIGALGVVGAAAGATAAVGLSGIKDAFTALSAADDDAVTGAAQTQRAVQAAARGVEQAEKGVTRAKRDAKDASREVTRARKEEAEQIEDLNLALKGAALTEQDAQLAIAEAIRDRDKTFGDPEADALERERSVLRVAQAEQRLREVQEGNADLAEEAAQANKKGVEGSDRVVAAKRAEADANEKVKDAEAALTDAQQALTDAQNQGSAAASKAEQALAKLSPSAREFVLGMRALGPELTAGLKMPVQETLFAGLTAPVTSLIRTSIPALREGMTGVAGAMNTAAKDTAAFFSTASAQQSIKDAFAGTTSFITAIGPGMKQATQGFLSFASAAAPALGAVGTGFGTLMGSIGQAFTDAANSGALTQLINNFGGLLAGLGVGLKPVIDGLIQAGNIVAPVLGPLFAELGKSLGPVLPQLAQVGAELAKGLMPVLPVAANLIGSLTRAVQPLIGPLSKIAVVVGDALVKAVNALAPAMGPVGDAVASLFAAASPLVPVIATVASGLLSALAPALKTIFDAAGPVIKMWAELMLPVFKQIQPIISQVAGQLAYALGSAMEDLAPLLPEIAKSFGNMVTSLAPLLPQLVDMGVKLLPPILGVFVQLVPIVLKAIDVFTWLAVNVLAPIVMPQLRAVTDTVSTLFRVMGDGIRMARNLFSESLSAIGGFFGDMSKAASSAWDSVVRNIAKAVKGIGELMQKAEWFPAAPVIRRLGDAYVGWADAHMATGGLFRGRGTTTSDSNLVALSDREFVTNAKATAANLPLLQAINSGWTPSPEFLHAIVGPVRGFAEGGLVTADELNTFAQGVEGAPYEWGGTHWGDCSGAVSALVNKAVGADPWATRGTTGNFSTWLASKGLQPGMGPKGSLNVGWFVGGPYGGHTAVTLPNGTNFEMGGARGNGQYGGQAVGAADPQFTDHMHLPPDFFKGGDQLPGQTTPPALGGSTPQVTTPGTAAAATKTRMKTAGELGKDAETIARAGVIESLGLGGFEQLGKRQGDNGASVRTSAAPPQQPQQPNPQGGNTFIAYGHTAEDIANQWSRLLWERTGGYGGRSWG